MGGSDGRAERASWIITNFFDSVNTAGRTGWNFSFAVEFDVRRQVVREIDAVVIGQVMFQSKLICSRIKLAKVVDAGICGACSAMMSNCQVGNNSKNKNQNERN